MRTIYIDADACPVTHIAEEIARRHGIPVTILCDTNHVMYSDYSTVKLIGAGADAVDLALINLCKAGDIVITQDYGVAALALGKGAEMLHGRQYRRTADGSSSGQKGPPQREARSERPGKAHGGRRSSFCGEL